MKDLLLLSNRWKTGLSALGGLAVFLQASVVAAQNLTEQQTTETLVDRVPTQALPLEQREKAIHDAYILGPGDSLNIELIDLPKLSGTFTIGPDGNLYLPRLRSLFAEGFTIEELRNLLTQKYTKYVRDPQVYVHPSAYRPVRVYVGGEVKRPGYYTITGLQEVPNNSELEQDPYSNKNLTQVNLSDSSSTLLFPTVFDAIRTAAGITPYTDLAKVQVIRKRAKTHGGGRIKTNLNFLSLITEGDESQNIRLFDGDVLTISKSPVVLRDQLLKAGQTNLTPQYLEVFVTGRVNIPGGVTVPQGSSLNQAISVAGGTKLIKGKIEFVRLKQDGTFDRRIFTYKPGAELNAPNNPVLAAGDLIRVRDSIFSASFEVINEITKPFVGIFSFYSLVEDLTE